jgi:hypothetical protein
LAFPGNTTNPQKRILLTYFCYPETGLTFIPTLILNRTEHTMFSNNR